MRLLLIWKNMIKHSMIIFVFFNNVAYTMQLAYCSNFILDDKKPITIETLKDARQSLKGLPLSKMQNGRQILSETLFTLSVYWTDEWDEVGINFAKDLLAAGGDPEYPVHTKRYCDEIELGKSSSFKSSVVISTESQNSLNTSKGKLLALFRNHRIAD